MFREPIKDTPLSGEMADSVFTNIKGESFLGDTTMVATLRALLSDRIGDGAVKVMFHQCNRVHDWSSDPNEAMRDIIGGATEADTVHICSIALYDEEKRKTELKEIGDHLAEAMPGFRLLEKIVEFYRRSFFVACCINPTDRTTVIVVDRLDCAKLHYLECSTLAFLPWFFDKEKGVSELEMRLIRSLGMKESDEYVACIAEFAKKYDFRTMRIRSMLPDFETRFDRIERDRVEEQIRSKEDELEAVNQRFGELIRERDDLNIRYLGLVRKIEEGSSGESEIMNYFIANKHIDLQSVSDSSMRFIVSGYLTFWDNAMAKRYIENGRSFLYGNSERKNADMKLLMTAIFLDETLKLRFCGAFKFDLRGGVDILERFNFGPEYSTYMPNPHLQYYGCLGSYHSIINKALQANDYITALAQSVASCGSLNWADSTVMNAFVRNINATSGNRAIELPDGTVVTPKEAIAWLKKQGKAHE